MIHKVLCISSQHLLHILSHLKQDNITRFNKPAITINRVQLICPVNLGQEYGVWLSLRDHELEGLAVIRL